MSVSPHHRLILVVGEVDYFWRALNSLALSIVPTIHVGVALTLDSALFEQARVGSLHFDG